MGLMAKFIHNLSFQLQKSCSKETDALLRGRSFRTHALEVPYGEKLSHSRLIIIGNY